MPVARLGGGPRRVSVTGPPPRFRYWAVHRVSVTVGLYHVSDTALRSYFRYQTVDRVSVTGSSTAFSMPCPNGASHTSPGCKPWESHPEKETRVLKERRIVAGLGLRPRPSLCGVPSEHTDSLGCGSQGDALGWYAMPPQGISDDNSFDTAGSPRFRYWATAAFPLLWPSTAFPILRSDRISDTRRSTAFPLLDRRPRFRCHAPTGHRIPAQGANPGNPTRKKRPAF